MATKNLKANTAPFDASTPALEGEILQAENPKKAATSAGEVLDPTRCGHVNEHWQGEGVQACNLAVGHAGNHSTSYQRLNHITNKYENAVSEWNDDAGIPLDVIEGMLAEEKAALPKAPPSLTQRLSNAEREQMRESSIRNREIPSEV